MISPDSVGDALLLAISTDHDDIALVILHHPIYQQYEVRFTANTILLDSKDLNICIEPYRIVEKK